VGDLEADVSEGHLFEQFNTVGPVASIRVCRDAVTRRSLGYAYVNFHNPADAERALDTMNNALIKGQPCRIMWSQRDPSIRKSGVGNIFIKNLDKSIDHKALYDTFSDFGNILSCKVAVDNEGNSKGYGFVHYETQEMADRAIATVDGMLVGDEKVFVGQFIPKKERMENRHKNFTNVYVKNLPLDVTEEVLREKWGAIGAITSVAISHDDEGKSKGFAFVNFETHETAATIVEQFNGKMWNGEEPPAPAGASADGEQAGADGEAAAAPVQKPLFVGRAQKKSERVAELRGRFAKMQQERAAKYQGVNLYVKNLDDELDEKWLKTEFGRFGQITSTRIMRNDKGNSKGFGFVCFTTPEEATKAVTEMHGRVYANKPIYVALAQPKEVRRTHLEAQYAQRSKAGRYPPAAAAAGMPAMYAAGTPPVYYQTGAPGTVPPQQFVYPPQQMAAPRRGAWQQPPNAAAAAGQYGQPIPGYGVGAPVQPQPQQRGPARAPASAPADAINVEFLQKMAPEDQFLCVSQRLYPIIQQQQPKLAPKITGMLRSWYLENNQSPEELVRLLHSPEALNAKITEALAVWHEHLQQAQEGADK
jgi:polyadenylate-binding protein